MRSGGGREQGQGPDAEGLGGHREEFDFNWKLLEGQLGSDGLSCVFESPPTPTKLPCGK